ncbi:hypothetical protein QBC36DRAFT_6131 [Triangularia setosa]|uniref:Uncharacterized protein n=1 Tax=Triangularia setosa TaxID=2587417 RepID=A0AAN6W8X1_9PEZI|nr:hypothetical protein QBC36DRAFT_6131 [Podospora setosa]
MLLCVYLILCCGHLCLVQLLRGRLLIFSDHSSFYFPSFIFLLFGFMSLDFFVRFYNPTPQMEVAKHLNCRAR